MATNNAQNESGWVGWVYFAGLMMVVTGFFQIISGLTALLNDQFLVSLHGKLLVLDFTKWGWIHLIYGVLLLVAGTNLFSGRTWAKVVAIILATFSFMLQFAFLSVYPVWSIVIMVVDVMIVYALTVHGSDLKLN